MSYSLAKDGDKYEIRYTEFSKKEFPNYEMFWARFIVPLTGRADGCGIGSRNEIDSLLEDIAMAHYTVYYHLGATIELGTKSSQEFSEDVPLMPLAKSASELPKLESMKVSEGQVSYCTKALFGNVIVKDTKRGDLIRRVENG